MIQAPIQVDLTTGELSGNGVQTTIRTVRHLQGIFRDEKRRQALDADRVVYRVQAFHPVREGEEGGLFWGTTFIEPGLVGDEYFMTRGHYHVQRNRGEYYMTIAGCGGLILMGKDRKTVFQPMRPGSVHYVPAHTAHRVANTGELVLAFLACWPSDAGHDYEKIAAEGFSARLRKVKGVPTLVGEDP
jgi:glucose-6-phosphate isomerase